MSVDILGTNCDQCVSMVQYCFTYTETIRLVRTESPGRPPTFTQLLKSEVKKTKRSLLNLGFERPVNRIGSPQDDAEEQKTTKKRGAGGRGEPKIPPAPSCPLANGNLMAQNGEVTTDCIKSARKSLTRPVGGNNVCLSNSPALQSVTSSHWGGAGKDYVR